MIYLLSGIIAWSFFASASSTAMISLAAQRNLTRNFSFPKEIIPLSCIGGILIEYLLKILILLALMCFLHVSFSASLLILIPAILVQTLFVAGVGLCLVFFFVYARDLDHVWRVFLQAGFFCTPVFYRLKTVSPEFRAILHWNPMTHMLLILRVPLLEGQWPPFFSIVYCLAWSTGLFFVGLWLFKKYEFDVAEKA
jgi:ABC-type polysaccharide/polyol phosphate export permease